MKRQAVIGAVRKLYLSGEVQAINVYYRLEHVASGAEIDALIGQWDGETEAPALRGQTLARAKPKSVCAPIVP